MATDEMILHLPFTDEEKEKEEGEEAMQRPGVSTEVPKSKYKVTCGAQNAILDVKRFASGNFSLSLPISM